MDVTVERSDSRLDGDFGGEDEEFDLNLFHFWDFPLEDVRADDIVGEWDDSSLECLGSMAVDALMPPAIQRSQVDIFPMDAHIDESHKPKQLPDYVGISSGSCILNQNASAETRESVAFQTRSPDSVVESSSPCFTGIFGAIPGKPRSRTVKTRPRLKPWNLMSPWHSAKSGSGSTSNHQKNIGRKKVSGDAVFSLQSSDAAKQLHSASTKKCNHCEITKTPQWREGPLGPKTLCNACGVRYRSGRLYPEYRPAASPTFVPDLHSNSHRKVLEMRQSHATCKENGRIWGVSQWDLIQE